MILITRHAPGEGPGYLAEFLARQGLPYRLIKIDENEPLPESLAEFSGLVLMGGPMSVNDPLPWIPPVLHLVREAMDADKPVLGHCLGGQLMSQALGGAVGRNPVKEIGWLPVQALDNDRARAWLGDLGPTFEVFHWHGETFSIPPGATHILASGACANQGFVIGKALGLQCHVEMTASMVRRWAECGRQEIAHPCATVQSAQAMTTQLDTRIRKLQRVADVVYARWIQGL